MRAYLRYVGGIARLDTLVRFGRAAALRQQLYGGPKAGASSGLPGWLVALLSVLGAGLLSIAAALLVRRRRAGGRSPARTIEAALQAAQRSGAPVSLISVSLTANGASPQRLAPVLRSRIRHSDRLCRLDALRFLVVAPDTDLQTAETLASDLRRHAERAEGVTADVEVAVHEADPNSTGPELLQRIRTAPHPTRAPRSTG